MGTKHLDYLCREFTEHYHAERPHQSLDNEPILPFPSPVESNEMPLKLIRCKQRLGGGVEILQPQSGLNSTRSKFSRGQRCAVIEFDGIRHSNPTRGCHPAPRPIASDGSSLAPLMPEAHLLQHRLNRVKSCTGPAV